MPFEFEDLGEQSVKNIARPVRAYALRPEAIAAMQAQPFDLVLMDANMPVMDGVTAVRQIRALAAPTADIPIHMVTANVFDEDRDRYRL